MLRLLFPNFGDYKLEKAILNLSVVMGQEFNTTMQTLKILQSEVKSLASVVLQNHHAPDPLSASAIIGEKFCFYVNQMGQIISNMNQLKERINIFH